MYIHLSTYRDLQYSKVRIVSQVREGEGKEGMASESSGCSVHVVGTRYRSRRDTVSVSLRRGVGVVGTQCPCRHGTVSVSSVGVVRMWCPCH